MAQEQDRESPIDRAVKRLDLAVTLLGQRISRGAARAQADSGSLVDADRDRLAAELDVARGREAALEAAGAEASAALANAITELRAAIDRQAEA